MNLPPYYSSLGPFRRVLQPGGGILTYHHVAPRPRGVRLKGLYVTTKLFNRQISELRSAGFLAEKYDQVKEAPKPRTIFVTFDDGFRDVFENAMPLLRNAGFTAIQFLVADFIGQLSHWQRASGEIPGKLMDISEIRNWLAAGNRIGSHTLRHPFLTRASASEAREEIVSSKKKLEDLLGVPVEHFCYPYGDWNRPIRDIVEAAGYKSACTTESGINTAETDRFALKRLTARYPSRNWRWLLG